MSESQNRINAAAPEQQQQQQPEQQQQQQSKPRPGRLGEIVPYRDHAGVVRPAIVTRVYPASGEKPSPAELKAAEKGKFSDRALAYQAGHEGVDLEIFGLTECRFVTLAVYDETDDVFTSPE